jgi:hypothetical protein
MNKKLTFPQGILRLKASRLLVFAILSMMATAAAWAQNSFVLRRLVSDIPGFAEVTDSNLVNPWGIAISGTSPFWISERI